MSDLCSMAAAASPWVTRFTAGMPRGGRALDVACGSGRHLRMLRAAGLEVVGIDRDLAALHDLAGVPGVELIAADLEEDPLSPPPFAGRRFDGVVVTNYLWRPLLGAIVEAVADGGVLVYETFARGHERLGRPRNPDFLLKPGELLDAVHGRLAVIAFEHVRLHDPDRMVQRICAVGLAHRWVADGGPSAAPG